MSSDLPLVSAIMPTRGRQQWAADAVRMFKEQTYPNKELVIIDERQEPSFPNGCAGAQHFFAPRLTVGGKRNLAVSRATGDIIIHWDSDDLYTPSRIEEQVKTLLEKRVDLVGFHIMEFIDEALRKRYEYHASPGYAIGVSQCYWRETWEARPFDSVDIGEDNSFLAGRRIFCGSAGRLITARIHSGNTSDKRKPVQENPVQWVELPWRDAQVI